MTLASPLERWRYRDKGKVQRIHAYSQGTAPTTAERLSLLQLIFGYCCRVFFILNVLLLFGTEVKRFHINRNFLNCPGKLVVPFFIIIRYRCFIIHTYINSFIAGINIRLRLWDFAFSDFLAIDIQNGLAPGPRLTTIEDKLVLNSMFPGGNGF